LKEQVITPRASARGSSGGKGRAGGIVQKPARRERGASGNHASTTTLRKVLHYLPLAGKVLLAVLTGVLLFAGYRAAASASFFQARNIDINATTRADADEIKRVVSHAVARTGVWRLDLSTLSAELERLPWVRKAVVSRVLPDGLRVRVTERAPLAVVRLLSSGKFVWVDEDAVTLGAMSPSDRMPTFFIRGWDEAATTEAQEANRERIQKYLALAHEWDAANLSERVSEVNLTDVRDVRAQLAGDDSQIEVRLGSKDFGPRLRRALDVLDEKRNTPLGPYITRLETLENRTIIGKSTGANVSTENADGEIAPPTETAPTATKKRETESANATRSANAKRTADVDKKKEKEQRAKKEQDKKEQAKLKAKGDTRPRRVG
jgi:hypothetical protein